jgi:integrase
MSSPLVKTRTPGVYRRGSRYVVVYRDPRGRQRKRSAATLAEARAIKASLAADVARGEFRALSRITFLDYALEWVESYQGRTARGLGEGTRDDYRDVLERDAIPALGGFRLAEIEQRDVKRYAAGLAKRGLAPSSVAKSVAPVRALLATAVEEGLIRSNPAAGIRLARRPAEGKADELIKALTKVQLDALLEAIPDEWRLFFRFLFETGTRIGEAIEVRFADVDLGRRWLTVERQFYRGRICPPKAHRGRRVRLTEGLARELWQSQAGRRECDLVFPAERGGRIIPSNLMSRVLKPAAVRAGLGEWVGKPARAESWVGFHTFRHTCATELFRSGWNPAQVQRFLGHADPGFTLRTYVHLLDEDLPEPNFGLQGWQHGGNQTGRDTPRKNVGGEAGFTLIPGKRSDRPKQAETAVAHS